MASYENLVRQDHRIKLAEEAVFGVLIFLEENVDSKISDKYTRRDPVTGKDFLDSLNSYLQQRAALDRGFYYGNVESKSNEWGVQFYRNFMLITDATRPTKPMTIRPAD